MDSTSAPTKISLPFADSGAKNTIPVASQIGITNGAASYTDGFPPLTRTPIVAGGIPPFGVDMNGILNAITDIQQWQSAGSGFKYDSAFATAIGGYPKGARLTNAAATGEWFNTVENNATNPDTGGAGWVPLPLPATIQQSSVTSAVAGGTADAITATFAPAIAALPVAPATLFVRVRAVAANTSATPTFNANGTGIKTIVRQNNVPLIAGDIAGPGHWLELQYDATLDKWMLLNPMRSAYIINAADFGVTCDGVTNDTAAFNLALTYANTLTNGQYKTLVFNPGTCLVTPGGVSDILCSIDAPRTKFKASSNVAANLLTIGYTPTFANGQFIRIFGLEGFSFAFGLTDPRFGYGLGFNAAATQFIGQIRGEIFYIAGFIRGVNGDCSTGFHIGTNVFNINTLWYCTDGIYSNSGNLEFENNTFNITYVTGCNTVVRSLASGTAHNIQNIYRIHALELHQIANSDGFNMAGANNNQNIYEVDAIYYNANTRWIVTTDGNATRSEFRLPNADYAKISGLGNVFKLEGVGNLNDPNHSRTIVYGPSPAPVTGTWSVGDIYVVNNPTVGGIGSYRYTASGWLPESAAGSGLYTPTRTLGANAAAATTYQAGWFRTGNTITVYGSIDVSATAANTATTVNITLPVASALTATIQLAGSIGGLNGNAMVNGFINADAAADQAAIHLSPPVTNSLNYSYQFSYQVL